MNQYPWLLCGNPKPSLHIMDIHQRLAFLLMVYFQNRPAFFNPILMIQISSPCLLSWFLLFLFKKQTNKQTTFSHIGYCSTQRTSNNYSKKVINILFCGKLGSETQKISFSTYHVPLSHIAFLFTEWIDITSFQTWVSQHHFEYMCRKCRCSKRINGEEYLVRISGYCNTH